MSIVSGEQGIPVRLQGQVAPPAGRQRGLTLIELLVFLGIGVVMLALAVPAFTVFIQNNQLTSQANDLVLAFAHARSEAVRRGVPVTVCSREDDFTCADETTWDDGWLVFVDPDGDGEFEADAGEQMLQVRPPLDGNTLTAGRDRATFNTSGFSPGFNATFRLCDGRGVNDARVIVLSNQGRATVRTMPDWAAIPVEPPNIPICP